MNEKMDRKNFIIIFVIIFVLVLLGALIGFLYRNKGQEKVDIVSVPVAKYIIVDGTLITKEMIENKEMGVDVASEYILDINNIVGKCVKNNVKVDDGKGFKVDDIQECN